MNVRITFRPNPKFHGLYIRNDCSAGRLKVLYAIRTRTCTQTYCYTHYTINAETFYICMHIHLSGLIGGGKGLSFQEMLFNINRIGRPAGWINIGRNGWCFSDQKANSTERYYTENSLTETPSFYSYWPKSPWVVYHVRLHGNVNFVRPRSLAKPISPQNTNIGIILNRAVAVI